MKQTYNWIDFKNKVIAEKLDTLKEFFGFKVEKDDSDNDYGASFLYKLMFLLRNSDADKINYARYVYLLSRMEPSKNSTAEAVSKYRKFSENPEDKKQLLTAIYIYAYLVRKRGN